MYQDVHVHREHSHVTMAEEGGTTLSSRQLVLIEAASDRPSLDFAEAFASFIAFIASLNLDGRPVHLWRMSHLYVISLHL